MKNKIELPYFMVAFVEVDGIVDVWDGSISISFNQSLVSLLFFSGINVIFPFHLLRRSLYPFVHF
jgi:hypothetical protein